MADASTLCGKGQVVMDEKKIIMNFSVPPSADDLTVIADEVLEILPDELMEFCDKLTLQVEEFPDEATESELELDDPYDLLVLYKNGREIAPGIEKKTPARDDALFLYRRPLLDFWCENEEDLFTLIRRLVIEELAGRLNFSDEEIVEMTQRHFQGMLS